MTTATADIPAVRASSAGHDPGLLAGCTVAPPSVAVSREKRFSRPNPASHTVLPMRMRGEPESSSRLYPARIFDGDAVAEALEVVQIGTDA